MNTTFKMILASGVAALSLVSAKAIAQEGPGHPRVNEVDNRVATQQARINAGVENGTVIPKQAGKDEARDARVQRQAARDEAKHNGHLTKHERKGLNHELDKNSKKIRAQSHAPVTQ